MIFFLQGIIDTIFGDTEREESTIYIQTEKERDWMALERSGTEFYVEYRDMEIVKMRIELKKFVRKMKAEGYLSSVNTDDLPSGIYREIQRLNQ
ncbi:hypothetical protein [Sporosarcina sp. NCCP-2222]|uniref:hypothetical protein n=2 Tax=Sporosarcina TaxID=1569 RepID=UPI0020C0DBCE|nr:hypothetical protein [Sporosarcina sp. NCCP-2222]